MKTEPTMTAGINRILLSNCRVMVATSALEIVAEDRGLGPTIQADSTMAKSAVSYLLARFGIFTTERQEKSGIISGINQPKGCSSEEACPVNSSAPFSVITMMSSHRTPNSPGM